MMSVVAIRIEAEAVHVLDVRAAADRISQGDRLPQDPAAARTHLTLGQGWVAEIWQRTGEPTPVRADVAVVITDMTAGEQAHLVLSAKADDLRGTVPTAAPMTSLVALFLPDPPTNEWQQQNRRQAWLGAQAVHRAITAPDLWWGEAPATERRRKNAAHDMIERASRGTRSWAEGQQWQQFSAFPSTWLVHEFTLAQAAAWARLRHGPDRLDVAEAVQWRAAGFTPETAAPWMSTGPKKSRANITIEPGVAASSVTAGWSQQEVFTLVSALRRSRRTGGNRAVVSWVRSEFSPHRAALYAAAGFTVKTARQEETASAPTDEQLQVIAALRS